jgi:hypothetical protein
MRCAFDNVLLETFGIGVLVYWTILEQAILLK